MTDTKEKEYVAEIFLDEEQKALIDPSIWIAISYPAKMVTFKSFLVYKYTEIGIEFININDKKWYPRMDIIQTGFVDGDFYTTEEKANELAKEYNNNL